jgi:prepilin-type N-terminal cleavage/methylation domain-containing protein
MIARLIQRSGLARRAGAPRRGRLGFTLVELLVVLGLLSAFTYLAFRLLTGGLSIWRIADESRDQEERARVVLDLLRRDLGVTDGGPMSRFVVDHGDTALGGETYSRTRLRFVRTISRAEEARLRAGFVGPAGATSSAPAVDTAAVDPLPETKVNEFARVPGVGLLEVAYATAPDPNAKDPAIGVLRRAVNPYDPESAARSFFTKDFFEKAKGGFLERSADVAGGVLHFGISLVSQDTRAPNEPPDRGGPETSWDSTRFEFSSPKDLGVSHFSFANETPLDSRDRIYPRRVQALLILEREDPDRIRPKLSNAIDAKTNDLQLDDPRPFGVTPGDFIKVGGEWMVVASTERGLIRVRTRGALGTRGLAHNAGVAIHRGRPFRLEVPLDCARDADLR